MRSSRGRSVWYWGRRSSSVADPVTPYSPPRPQGPKTPQELDASRLFKRGLSFQRINRGSLEPDSSGFLGPWGLWGECGVASLEERAVARVEHRPADQRDRRAAVFEEAVVELAP